MEIAQAANGRVALGRRPIGDAEVVGYYDGSVVNFELGSERELKKKSKEGVMAVIEDQFSKRVFKNIGHSCR